jgi:hypothetical protein
MVMPSGKISPLFEEIMIGWVDVTASFSRVGTSDPL